MPLDKSNPDHTGAVADFTRSFLVENIVSADALQEDHAWTGNSLFTMVNVAYKLSGEHLVEGMQMKNGEGLSVITSDTTPSNDGTGYMLRQQGNGKMAFRRYWWVQMKSKQGITFWMMDEGFI